MAFDYSATSGLSEWELGPTVYFRERAPEVYVQWTARFGRHADDSAGRGAVGAWKFHGGGSNYGMKIALFFGNPDSSQRVEFLAPGPIGTSLAMTSDAQEWRRNSSLSPTEWEGKDVKITIRLRAGSSGSVTVWAAWDGQERLIIPESSVSVPFSGGWSEMRTPSVMAKNAIDMTMYISDLVVWRP